MVSSRVVAVLVLTLAAMVTAATTPSDPHMEDVLPTGHYQALGDLDNYNTVPVLRQRLAGWKCQCWNTTSDGVNQDSECVCFGKSFNHVPSKLHRGVQRLTVTDAGIRTLRKDTLQPYRSTLKDIVLSNLQSLDVIESGTFRNLDRLRTIYISYCPQIKLLNGLLDGITTTNFRSLRVMNTGLQQIPDLNPLYEAGNIIQMIDLEGNQISAVSSHSIQIKAEQVILNYNRIPAISKFAFNGSQIGMLSLKGNTKLVDLPREAFSGILSIRELDLTNTAIVQLPTSGLETLEVLRIGNTPALKVIPSVYNFKHLKEAWLTHSFHCCAFKYPARHDPSKHANYRSYIKHVEAFCKVHPTVSVEKRQASLVPPRHSNRIVEDVSHLGEFWGAPLQNNVSGSFGEEEGDGDDGFRADAPFRTANTLQPESTVDDERHSGQIDGDLSDEESSADDSKENDYFGVFHQTTAVFSNNNAIICGSLSIRFEVKCYPAPDELNPCEDIMGSHWLRVSVWVVLVTAIFGNLAVIVVLFSSCADITVPKFLMCHLAIADLCMGLYLLLLATMDVYSMGVYFNVAYDWQFGWGCQVAGFLTVFASQLSIFTLSVVTLERWFAIAHAIYLNRRIKLVMAARIMAVGWVYSLLMAALPLLGVSNYSATSICLPMESRNTADMVYLLTLLVTTGLAFLLIVVCYTQIYFSLDTGTRSSSGCGATEMTVARKMALLVFTDFACWAPIAFFSLTALAGFPLIDVTRSKILLVFFYPLNSCANPYLYALLTTQYKRDLLALLSRLGLCTRRAHRYKLTYSLPTTNNSNPIPLTARSSIPCSTNNEPGSRKHSKTINEIFV